MQLTLTPEAKDAIARVLVCKKSIALSGGGLYIRQEAQSAAVRALDLLMQDNPNATGLSAMLAEVDAITADESGEFAAMREQLAIESDEHGNRNKAHVAHLKQTLAAIKLERQFAQEFAA